MFSIDRPSTECGTEERRSTQRYSVALELRYRSIRGQDSVDTGTGISINLSAGGILFRTQSDLRIGEVIEISLPWPAWRPEGIPAINLYILGQTLRTEGNCVAVRIWKHFYRPAPPTDTGEILTRR